MNQDEVLNLIEGQGELLKIELREEVAHAIAQGIQLQSDRPVAEQGGTEILYGDVVGIGQGYVSVQFPDQVDPLPVASNSVLNIGDRVTVARTPSTAVVIGGGGGAQTTPTPETPPVVASGRPWTYENIIRATDQLPMASYNGGGYAQDYTLTDTDGTVYALWYSSELKPLIGRKRLTDLDWSVKDLSTVAGNPLSSPINSDGHNFTTFGIDGETGLIHIAGNMHAQPLNYLHSTKGVADPTFDWSADWSGPSAMTGTNENSVTYPMFHRLLDGTLIFFYRNGSSGDGDQYCKRWVAGAWHDLGQITDGQTDNVSAYLLPPVIDKAGNVDMIFNYRLTGSANTNVGMFYAKIVGLVGGGTMAAVRSDGTTITLPIRLPGTFGGTATSDHWPEPIADFPAPDLLNDAAPGAFQPCDPAGFPHSSFMSKDSAGAPQHYHIFRDMDGWKCDQITTFGQWVPAADWGGSTPAGDASRMKIVNTPSGKTLAIGHWPAEGRRGKLWCYDLTPGQPGYIPNTSLIGLPSRDQPTGRWYTKTQNQPFPIAAFPDQGDMHVGFERLVGGGILSGNELQILITSSSQRFYHDVGINALVGYNNASSESYPSGWGTPDMEPPAGMLGVYTVDLTQLDRFRDRDLNMPTIKVVSESSGGNIPIPRNTAAFTPAGDLLAFQRESIVNAAASGGSSIVFQKTAAGNAYGNDGSGNQPSIIVPSTYSGSMLFARMLIQMRLEPAGSVNLGFVAACIVEAVAIQLSPSHTQNETGNVTFPPSPNTFNRGTSWNDSSAGTPGGSNVSQSNYSEATIFTSSWQALRQFMAVPGGFGGYLGRIRLAARSGNNPAGARGFISSVTLQLGVLE